MIVSFHELAAAFIAEVQRCAAGLLYSVEPGAIRILAVMNLRRRPAYWVNRT